MSGFTYVAKPERIQAFDMSLMNPPKVIHMPQWLLDAIVTKRINNNACISEGALVAIQLTDYIVRTADGELHVWSKEAFERRYEAFAPERVVPFEAKLYQPSPLMRRTRAG